MRLADAVAVHDLVRRQVREHRGDEARVEVVAHLLPDLGVGEEQVGLAAR